MKMYHKLASYAVMAMAFGAYDYPEMYGRRATRENPTRKELDRKAKNLKINKYGLKCFVYSGVEVWARNEKNALRKAKNQGLVWSKSKTKRF